MRKILPSILGANDTLSFIDNISIFNKEGICDINEFHVDIMDGIFVDNICYNMKDILIIKEKGYLADVHLMVKDPTDSIRYALELGADSITVHHEIPNFYDVLDKLLELKLQNNLKIGVSLKPNTSIDVLDKYIDKIDIVLLMSVNPGMGGQPFNKNAINKIKELRDKNKNICIIVDGGINNTNYMDIFNSGADKVVIGSYLTKDITKLRDNLNNLLITY